jgi:cytochrome c oxidase subunit 3
VPNAQATTEIAAPSPGLSLWGGGLNPYGVSHQKLGMWLFIISDSLTFAAILFGYAYLRAASDHWPTPFEFFPSIVVSTMMTFVLLTSSLTMVLAVHNAKLGDRRKTLRWLAATMILGLAFVGLHLNEWRELIHHGMTPGSNPWGDPLFGGTFFTITGLHMVHVVSGVIYLGVIARRTVRSRNREDDVEISGLYWHFVDLVWMFVFPLIYLMSVNMGGAATPGGH